MIRGVPVFPRIDVASFSTGWLVPSFQAGLLTSGSSIFHTFPGDAPSGKT